MDDVPLTVAEELHLDVPGAVDVLLHVDPAVLEGRLGLLACRRDGVCQRRLLADDAHAAPAAAGGRLDEDGVADALGDAGHVHLGGEDVATGDDGDAGLLGDGAGGVLVAEPEHRASGGGPDELDLRGPADLGEAGVLAQEAVARMDRLGVRDLGGRDEPVDDEVALDGGAGADADRVVGECQVRRVAVGLAVHGDDLDAEVVAGADDPQGDLSTVRDENTLEHDGGGRPWVLAPLALVLGGEGLGVRG